WRLSNTIDVSFCVDALDDALDTGTPKILNTDQGPQFTSEIFIGHVLAAGLRFSMDGRDRLYDNIFIERLWRSLKCVAVYLDELRDGLEAERIIGSWVSFYNEVRPHSALGERTPREAYREGAEVS
ncbi:MAG: integrase core domain-containing protein, partial [Gemmatimonadota bacterium]|nr:integrase core domain-containing protein [Gemmatimonadota bacterium]